VGIAREGKEVKELILLTGDNGRQKSQQRKQKKHAGSMVF
jgi:hypothetical protein